MKRTMSLLAAFAFFLAATADASRALSNFLDENRIVAIGARASHRTIP